MKPCRARKKAEEASPLTSSATPHEPQRGRPPRDGERRDVEQASADEGRALADAGDEGSGGQDPDELPDPGEGDDEGGGAEARAELVGPQRRDRDDRAGRGGGEEGRPEGGYGDAPPAEGLARTHPPHPLLPAGR